MVFMVYCMDYLLVGMGYVDIWCCFVDVVGVGFLYFVVVEMYLGIDFMLSGFDVVVEFLFVGVNIFGVVCLLLLKGVVVDF